LFFPTTISGRLRIPPPPQFLFYPFAAPTVTGTCICTLYALTCPLTNKNMIDYATLTIVVVIIVAFCAPFVYSHQKKKRHEKRLFNDFMAKASQYQLQIGTYDLWRRSYVIGIDEERSQL